ncbi:DEAD/DEAH box helicase family protein [Myxococcota bacterium]|nr:DEAD/DEAH box helicase family protein [Myxococcota bacterium]
MHLSFDRGTLVPSEVPPGLDPAELPGMTWDPRVRRWRAPAWRHAELAAALSERGVRFSDGVRNSDVRTQASALAWAPLDLRPYQDAAVTSWELSGRRAVLVLPTGSGKTRIALAAMARARLPALCLVPTRVLLAQWCEAIAAVRGEPPACLGDGRREVGPVTVATFESAWRHMERIGDRFDLLVIDEVHHFGQGIRDEALEMCVAAARLGLTATPPREGDAGARLAERVGPVAYELGMADLAGSWLAPFHQVTLHVDLTRGERAAYDHRMAAFQAVHREFRRLAPEGSWEDFVRMAARTPPGRAAMAAQREARRMLALTEGKRVVLASLVKRHSDARVLIFTADNDTAYRVARDHLVMPITCDIPRQERARALAAFREGRLRALVSSRVLNEGIDVPDADVGIVLGGTQGEREHVQRVGRLLRPSGPEKRAIVYEVVARNTVEVRLSRARRKGVAPRRTDPLPLA